jgi:hypothetical protein
MSYSTGRSNAKPSRAEKDAEVLRTYAELHRGRRCEWCTGGVSGHSYPFEEIHHILGGSGRRHDADWNIVAICRFHHQHPVHGFHGAKPLWGARRALERKREQGYQLPDEAWGYLREGRDACPTPVASQEHNREVTIARLAAQGGAR